MARDAGAVVGRIINVVPCDGECYLLYGLKGEQRCLLLDARDGQWLLRVEAAQPWCPCDG